MEIENILTSLGGPLLMIGPHLLHEWRGINGSSYGNTSAETDYARACSTKNYLDLLPVKNGSALVLGDMPMPTSFFLKKNQFPVVYRYMYAPNGFDYRLIPEMYGTSEFPELESCVFQADEHSLLIFDATFDAKSEKPESLTVPLQKGRYIVNTYNYVSDDLSMILHDFNVVD